MAVAWNFPTRILFGEGASTQVGDEAQALGGTRALIVTDPGVVEAGLCEPIAACLKAAGIESQVFDGVRTNPTDEHVAAATAAYGRAKADIIIGLGGGSAIDVAKLVRICGTHPLPLADYADDAGGSTKIGALPPMLAVPTTAGTGSEVGRSSVATMGATHRKTVFFAPHLIPNVAVLDPKLTQSMPTTTTAATGFDALTHCIEAFSTEMDHPMAEAIAQRGIRLVGQYLQRAVIDPQDMEARGGMLKAATFGAVAFQKGLGACHSLAHPLSAEADLHHGLANALCLPAVVDFNRTAVPAKLAQVAKLLGSKAPDDDSLAFECAGAIRSLRERVGLPDGLGAVRVPEAELPKLAELAFEDACHLENPRRCTRDDLLALYKASY